MSRPLSPNLDWVLANPIWASALNPLLGNPILQGKQIDAELVIGVTTIPHGLGRPLRGWILVDVDAAATIFRSNLLNATTLTLTSNAACNVSLWVY